MSSLHPDTLALIGVAGLERTSEPIEASELRRFRQATLDPSAESKLAPPLFPLHALRAKLGDADPFDRFADQPDWDGVPDIGEFYGLPPLGLPTKRVLNGGVRASFFKLAEVGDRITSRSRVQRIEEKQGSSGPLIVVDIETEYENDRGELLVRVTTTLIHR